MPRTPKPTVLKILEGNRGKRPLNKREPQPANKVPTCPDWLDAGAKLCWKRLVKILHPIGLLTLADGDSLAMYCRSWSVYVAAQRELQSKGFLMEVIDSQGREQLRERPEVALANSALEQLMKLSKEFGMTPSARSRMMVLPAEQQKQDRWEGLLADAS